MLALGDSKTSANGYPLKLVYGLNIQTLPSVVWQEALPRHASGGWTVDDLRVYTQANIASVTPTPDYALINIGANDSGEAGAEAAWKVDMQAILDAIHSQFASCQIYIMRIWERGSAYNTPLAMWVGDIVTLNSSFTHLGPDESIYLENGDDGVTYTSDGAHPTEPAGYQLTADQWRAVLGH